MKNKGQVTIFIIISIVIVSSILAFVLWRTPTYILEDGGSIGFEGCVKDVMEEKIIELELNAGFSDDQFSHPYDGKNFVYLCYSENYFETCTVQVPFLKNVFSESLNAEIRDTINLCYEENLDALREEGYQVVAGQVEYEIEIQPGIIGIEINAPTIVGGSEFTKFNIRLNSPLYDLLMIATSIVQFESVYGDSDTEELGFYYPDYYVNKMKREDGTSVYTIEHRTLDDKFLFASRSLVYPAGYYLGGEE